MSTDKLLFSDNCWVKTVDIFHEYLAIKIEDNSVYFYRYVVPGRFDIYSFKMEWEGQACKMKYFTDCNMPLLKAVKQFQRDLEKLKVKELIQSARTESKRCSVLLDCFLRYFGRR